MGYAATSQVAGYQGEIAAEEERQQEEQEANGEVPELLASSVCYNGGVTEEPRMLRLVSCLYPRLSGQMRVQTDKGGSWREMRCDSDPRRPSQEDGQEEEISEPGVAAEV